MPETDMITHENVPFSLADINKQWLTEALTENGILKSGHVTSLEHRIIGTEAGFNGEVAILTLQYSDPETDAPTSMVLKIPTALKNRILGQTMGLYEKEIRFYRQLNPSLHVRTPRHYYSALDVADDQDVILERMYGLNSLPMWLISLLSKIATWAIAKNPRKYVLLIEDLSGYRMGDQMKTLSDQDTRRILRAMAKLHGQYWQSESLETMSWIAPVNSTTKIVQMMYLQSIDKFRAANQDQLTQRQTQIIDWVTKNGIPLTEKLGEEAATLLHGDMRMDNICFDDAQDEVLLFDWQTMQRGPAGMDLAYFLSASVPADAGEARVTELIAYYHEQLLAEGVAISVERLRWQYQMGMLSMVHRVIPTLFQDQMDLGSDRGPKMMQAWVEKILSKLEPIPFEDILDSVPD